jgi:hypothetical protein
MRLAHAERAAVIRHTFSSLLWWRRKATVQRTAADPALKVPTRTDEKEKKQPRCII